MKSKLCMFSELHFFFNYKKKFSRTTNGNVLVFCMKYRFEIDIQGLVLWRLTPLSTIFQLYHGSEIVIQPCTNEITRVYFVPTFS